LKKEDGLIDWTRTREQVCNQIRAMQPWPTAYTFLHRLDKLPVRTMILRAVPFPVRAAGRSLIPGSLFMDESPPGALLVATGDNGSVLIKELQPAGKKRMTAGEFLRGNPLREGGRFGPEQP
jgi:methionyl-tRNA formyltransferase